MDRHCEYSKDGKRCGAYKIKGDSYCFTHSENPEIVSLRSQALAKAAESRKLYLPIEEGKASLNLPRFIDLSKPRGIKRAYITLIRAAAKGEIDERRCGVLIYALNGYVATLDKLDSLKEESEGMNEQDRAILSKYMDLNRVRK